MQAETATSTLAGWHGALTQVCSLGEILCDAIERDDLIAAISTMMQLRRARTNVLRVDVSSASLEKVDADSLRTVRASLERSNAVEAIMEQWLGRAIPADAQLLSDPVGIAVVADMLLPTAWDFERELVILAGAEMAPVAELLSDVGQRRIVFFGEGDVPANVVKVRSFEEMHLAIRMMTPVAPERLVVRGSESAGHELIKKCAEVGMNAMSELRVHSNTIRSFSRTWVEQGATNLPGLARWPSVEDIGDELAGKPMVIVAPGPSLAKNIDQLRALQGKVIICCFSHSLKPVVAAGIAPDIIVCVDPQDVQYHFAGIDTSNSYIVNGATVHPALFELPCRGILTLSSNGPIDQWLFDGIGANPAILGGGSVATTAFSLAVRWKCEPIMFMGLDLSFPGGKYYVSTSTDGEAVADVSPDGTMQVAGWSKGFKEMKSHGGPQAVAERVVELPGWHGDNVPSSFMFALFHRWFIDKMRTVTDLAVYNCTEGGAWIEGMQHVPFADVTIPCTVDAQQVLAATVAKIDAPARRKKVAKHIEKQLVQMRRARKLATHAQSLIVRDAPEHELERAERALVRAIAPLGFASILAERAVDRAFQVASHDVSTAKYLAASSALFRAIVDVMDIFVPIFEGAHGKLT
ncbi:MAG TPA: 6-hydroxymethylpterin diphosphokinase MptE-like protein [Kofleriaceae bacterium]